MEESFEAEVTRIWDLAERDLVVKLDKLHLGLNGWTRRVRMDLSNLKHELGKELDMLLDVDCPNKVLDDLLDTWIHLN